jgi:16S rRNA (cytosine967-C5)-methyltransferase
MPQILRRRRLEGRDAAFATELAFGTVRWQGLYDAVIAVAADRPVDRIDPGLLDVLRLGCHQLLSMRVPPHAAADQTVGLARTVSGHGASGFVNAVLRRVAEKGLDEWREAVAPTDGGAAALAVRHSHPEWVVSALRAALLGHGRATPDTVDGELTALLEVDNVPPRVHLVARPGLATVDELVGSADAERSLGSPLGAVLRGGDPAGIAAVREGRAAVQDEGSQHLALAVAGVEVAEGTPARWLDLCAGPGGKSGVLGGLAVQRGADLVAVEVSPHRADLVRHTLGALGARAAEAGRTVEVRTADGREVGTEEPGAYGRVLVDAPCTGLGALRRRPEARWRRQPSDLATLGPLQRALLASALDAVAPGGVVGYATCSPHVAETRFVVADVLKKRDDVDVLDARPLFTDAVGDPLPELGDGPYVQLWPHVHGTDAMFLALLRRRAEG